MLLDVLSDLSRPGAAIDYEAAARGLGVGDRREAAAVHLGGLLEVVPSRIDDNHIEFGGLSIKLVENPGAVDLRYEDLAIGYTVDGVRLTRADGPATMSGMLSLLTYALTRSDTLFYLSAEMRNDRIRELATRVGASERFTRFTLANAPAIERKLAA